MKIYDKIGQTYKTERWPDLRIEEKIQHKLFGIKSVLNIGAGTGSYEPKDKFVVGLDPSVFMLRNRSSGAAPCVLGGAEALPFKSSAFDGAMAVLTIHHWSDWKKGIQEALRICRCRLVIMTWDPGHAGFWLTQDYLREISSVDSAKFPSMVGLQSTHGNISIEPILVPWDCKDGFMGAYWRRPEAYLDESKRKSISTLALNSSTAGLERLKQDLSNGEWERKYGYLRSKPELDIGYRLVVLEKGTT